MISPEVYLRFSDAALVAMRDIVIELGDDLANRRPDLPGANSPVQILTHCLGVCAAWASTTNLDRPVPRDRDAEFTATGPVAELAAATDRLRADFAGWVRDASPADPPVRPVRRDEYATQGEVLLHVYEELAQHRGQLELTRDLLRATA
ncbi:hypothetical protein GCM10027517_04020 [Phycicoccus ginsengisoli]